MPKTFELIIGNKEKREKRIVIGKKELGEAINGIVKSNNRFSIRAQPIRLRHKQKKTKKRKNNGRDFYQPCFRSQISKRIKQ